MSFEAKIPEHIKSIELKMRRLESEKFGLLHDCNCDHCELRDEYEDPDEGRIRAEEIDKEIDGCEQTIKLLEKHAEWHGVPSTTLVVKISEPVRVG